MMKRTLCLILALILSVCAVPAFAEGGAQTHYLFGYIIDASASGFEMITDDEQMYSFTRDSSTQIAGDEAALLDSAVVVAYLGDLNVNAQAQTVKVAEVAMLTTLYGQIEAASADTVSVRALNDDGEPGQLYLFDRGNADVVVGEDGIQPGDEVEVAFRESMDQLIADQVQSFDYVHITVYGQIEGELE